MNRSNRTPTNPAYNTYNHMKGRCSNKQNPKYPLYGGRGIKVCDRWLDSFDNFMADMGAKPKGCTIDRIDNDGHYEPGNCRWATPAEQSRNTRKARNNRQLSAFGETRTVAEWSRLYGISATLIFHRLVTGWSAEDAVKTPVMISKRNTLHKGWKQRQSEV